VAGQEFLVDRKPALVAEAISVPGEARLRRKPVRDPARSALAATLAVFAEATPVSQPKRNTLSSSSELKSVFGPRRPSRSRCSSMS
jgi:hypothetical protein